MEADVSAGTDVDVDAAVAVVTDVLEAAAAGVSASSSSELILITSTSSSLNSMHSLADVMRDVDVDVRDALELVELRAKRGCMVEADVGVLDTDGAVDVAVALLVLGETAADVIIFTCMGDVLPCLMLASSHAMRSGRTFSFSCII